MTVAVAHVMTRNVFLVSPDHTVQQVRELMARKRIRVAPVVGRQRKVMGVVTTTDLARRLEDDTPIERVMTDRVATIPANDTVSVAARIMRKRRIHHLVVADGHSVVGILSSFDLLRLVEEQFA